jgi:hypothetical protein
MGNEMRVFKPLKPDGIPREFDVTVETEAPLVEVQESKGKIVVSYAFPGFYLVDETTEVQKKKVAFMRPHIEAVGSFAESGKPLLPSFGRYVQIPKDCDFKVKVEKSNKMEYADVILYPAQTKLLDQPIPKHDFEYDSAFYAKDEWYPAEVVDVSGPFEVDDYTALLLSVRPLQCNPKQKKLIGWSNIKVTIEVSARGATDVVVATADTRTVNREAFGNLIVNPGRHINERLLVPSLKAPPVFPIPKGPEFLIIYADSPTDKAKDLTAAAQALASWKNMIGLSTEIVPVSTVNAIPLNPPTITDDVSRMKSYIRGRRGALFSALRYVLLLGDEDAIPSQKILVNNGFIQYRYTDFYYSTKTDWVAGSYDFPWLSIGRITSSTLEEAKHTVDKIIAYEKTPPSDPSYYDKITLAAYFSDSLHTGREDRSYVQAIQKGVYERLAPLGFQINRYYTSDYLGHEQEYHDGSAIPATVKPFFVNDQTATNGLIQAVTEGRLFIGHRDHGDFDGWYQPPFKISHLNNIHTTMPSIFYSINCLTGTFGYNPPPALKDCFAEVLLQMDGAAPSLIAATDLSNTSLNDSLIEALFDATFGGVIPTFPGSNASYPIKRNRLGDTLNYAKYYLPVALPGPGVRDHFEIYHVMGDPTLEIWTEQPKIVRIWAWLRRDMVDISMSACPSNSVVTFWYRGKLLKKLEPSSNRFSVSIRGLLVVPRPPFPGPVLPITVCFKAPGYRFVQTSVRTLPGPYPPL